MNSAEQTLLIRRVSRDVVRRLRLQAVARGTTLRELVLTALAELDDQLRKRALARPAGEEKR